MAELIIVPAKLVERSSNRNVLFEELLLSGNHDHNVVCLKIGDLDSTHRIGDVIVFENMALAVLCKAIE